MNFGTKTENGFVWPEWDVEASRIVVQQVKDVEIALQYVKTWDVCVQAGGNVGVWARYLKKYFKIVHTFEPEPHNYACLEKNCPELDIVKWQNALGITDGMRVGIDYPEGRKNMGACCVTEGGDIPVIAIDFLNMPSCGLIQLDIEGYEVQALRGAALTIDRFKPVIMVEDKGLSTKYGYAEGWSDGLLKMAGYRVAARVNRDVVLVHGE